MSLSDERVEEELCSDVRRGMDSIFGKGVCLVQTVQQVSAIVKDLSQARSVSWVS
jgi:hypothetical protein